MSRSHLVCIPRLSAPGRKHWPIIHDSNEVEYWILELVVESRIPLALLAAQNLCELLNVPIDGFDHDELLSGLGRLFASGDIRTPEDEGEVPLNLAALDKVLESPSWQSRPLYELTPQGGALWESLAQADWERYTPLIFYERDGIFCGEITAMDRDRAEAFLAEVRAYKEQILYEHEEWLLLKPWQATYWKTLEHGHRVIFRHRSVPVSVISQKSRPSREFWKWFQRPFGP